MNQDYYDYSEEEIQNIVEDLGMHINDLILLKTAVSHIDADARWKILQAYQLVIDARDILEKDLNMKTTQEGGQTG